MYYDSDMNRANNAGMSSINSIPTTINNTIISSIMLAIGLIIIATSYVTRQVRSGRVTAAKDTTTATATQNNNVSNNTQSSAATSSDILQGTS